MAWAIAAIPLGQVSGITLILIWTKDMVVSALKPVKNSNASHNRVLTREGLSFEFFGLQSRLIIFL